MTRIITFCSLLIAYSTNVFGQDTIPKSLTDSLKKEIFYVVEESATFPGGMGKFYQYISKKINYPISAKRSGISGRVYVEFVINKDGSIEDESVRAVPPDELAKMRFGSGAISNKDCELEAIRLLKECPNWNPGMQKGQPVRQKMILPIEFRQ